ncbi:hypothetical protein BURPSPAST_H0310 [Burkholderia pseudomallei Pasteur 52237]|nr:hypothetical protein BURPSPAST_H0310 [Burkholderia pseudomallei Pasteur 52237]
MRGGARRRCASRSKRSARSQPYPNRFARRAVRGGARRRSASIEAMRAADSPAAHACPNRKPRGTRAMPHAVMPP